MFKAEFYTNNASFDGTETTESADILRAIAKRVERGETGGIIKDANGNSIGEWSISSD
jgi:hypothetical protein